MVFQIRLKIYEMLPGSPKLALRLCCKQLKWEIDHLVGLLRVWIEIDSKRDCENVDFIKHDIRELTIGHRVGNRTLPSPWILILILANGDFIHLNRLSLSELSLQAERDLVTILTALSNLDSLCELSLDLRIHYMKKHSISSNLASTEIVYNFPNLKTLNFNIKCFVVRADTAEGNTILKSFMQMYCPQLKFLSVQLGLFDCKLQTHLVWFLELVEKFSDSLQYLKVLFQLRSVMELCHSDTILDWETSRQKIEKKALKVGSQLNNLKEMDIAFDRNHRPQEISVWTNFFHGIRISLEKLKIDFQSSFVWKLYGESALFQKNSLPNLKFLTVPWQGFSLDLKTITQISDCLETLELRHLGSVSRKVENMIRFR